ncbi:putative nuclease [Synechococcus sp. A18-25c]|uniref:thermonuclease family protein n=1 Tax=Synechococcus sp. A18-25c TaxID=1866938 RepID=UPI0018604876|nr:thermonuclease family protein [Synechococcus sp. A18-25c]QNJ19797.1 putative nuclease [Synechococcus sp. A18-25c]
MTSLSIPRLLLSGAILSATLSATLSSAAWAEPHPRQAVMVLAINNGQGVLVDLGDQGRAVRLACVQAPLAQQQPWSRLAIQQLQRLLPVGSEVVLELRARDVYGRLVARLLMQDNDVAQPLLLQGVVFA